MSVTFAIGAISLALTATNPQAPLPGLGHDFQAYAVEAPAELTAPTVRYAQIKSNIEDPEWIRVNGLLEKVEAGEMSFEETGLPEPDPTAQQGAAYKWYTRVKEAKMGYERHMKRKEREAGYAAAAAEREADAAAIKAEREAAQAGAADYAAQAEAEAEKARKEAEKMMEEMRKKYNLPK